MKLFNKLLFVVVILVFGASSDVYGMQETAGLPDSAKSKVDSEPKAKLGDQKDAKEQSKILDDKIVSNLTDAYKACFCDENQSDKRIITVIRIIEVLQNAYRQENMSHKDLAKILRTWLAQNKINSVDSIRDQNKRTLFDVAESCGYMHVCQILQIVKSGEAGASTI